MSRTMVRHTQLLILSFIHGIAISNGKICSERGERYCCANSEELNGSCVACKTGFYSQARGRCQPCNHNKFGFRCVYTCECKTYQRCDNVKGCLNVTITTTLSETTTDFFTVLSSEKGNETSQKVTTVMEETTTTYGNKQKVDDMPSSAYETTVAADEETDKAQHIIAFTTQQLIVVALSTIILVLFITLTVVCCKYRQRSSSKSLDSHVEFVSLADSSKTKNEFKLMTGSKESLYDEIDESAMVNIIPAQSKTNQLNNYYYIDIIGDSDSLHSKPQNETKHNDNDYLDVLSESNSSASGEKPRCENESDYLTPIHSLTKDTTENNTSSGDEASSQTSDTSSIRENIDFLPDTYFNPYTSLKTKPNTDNTTEKTEAIIHRDDEISDSEEDDSDNDHKYSHTYQSLSNANGREDEEYSCPDQKLSDIPKTEEENSLFTETSNENFDNLQTIKVVDIQTCEHLHDLKQSQDGIQPISLKNELEKNVDTSSQSHNKQHKTDLQPCQISEDSATCPESVITDYPTISPNCKETGEKNSENNVNGIETILHLSEEDNDLKG